MYGQEFAYTSPDRNENPLDLYLRLKDNQDQQARYQQQLEREQRRYQDGLMIQAMSQLDFKHFATGTPLDPVIHNSLESALKNVSKKIMENGDVSAASVYYDVANAANDIATYATKASNIRGVIEQSAKELGKNPSIDGTRLMQTAITNAFSKLDPKTGHWTVKDPSEIDDTKDWVGYTLENNPDQVVKGSGALDALLKGADKKPYENEYSVDRGGVKRKIAFKGELFPYNQLELDGEGRPVFDPKTGQAKVGVRSVNIAGIPVATDDEMAYFTSNPGANAYLNALVKKAGFDPNSDEGQLLKRTYLLNHLQNNNQGVVNKTKDEVDESQLQSQIFRKDMKAFSESFKNALGAKGDISINDVFGDIQTKGQNKRYAIPLNELNPQTQEVLIKHAQTLMPPDEKGKGININRIWVRKNTDGSYSLMKSKADNKMDYNDLQISPLNFKDVNLMKGLNTTVKERQKVLQTNQPQFQGVPKGGF